jgi:acyl-CoA oxidase
MSILLLEWRAALLVREHSRTVSEPDASVNQRVSKAVTEAFIAAQVGEIIDSLSLPANSTSSVRELYLLVSLFVS